MNPNPPLMTLLAHVERERDAAMAEAKRVELEHRKALRQAEQLLGYRRDLPSCRLILHSLVLFPLWEY